MEATVASTDTRFIRQLDDDFARMSNLVTRNQLAASSATDTRPGQREASHLRDIEAHHTAGGGFQYRSLGERGRSGTWYIIGPIQLSSKLVQSADRILWYRKG